MTNRVWWDDRTWESDYPVREVVRRLNVEFFNHAPGARPTTLLLRKDTADELSTQADEQPWQLEIRGGQRVVVLPRLKLLRKLDGLRVVCDPRAEFAVEINDAAP